MRWRIPAIFSGIIVVLAVCVIALTLLSRKPRLVPSAGIGGPFSLVDHRGKTVTEKDFSGKPMLVFFGFTFCPDVCPTTLMEVTLRLKELGPAADKLNVLFVTVDPKRDTPEQLALYLSSFDPRITGLSGTEHDVGALMIKYRAYSRKVPLPDGDYTMDHTATLYMMNPEGQFVGFISYGEPEESVRKKIGQLLDDANRRWGRSALHQ